MTSDFAISFRTNIPYRRPSDAIGRPCVADCFEADRQHWTLVRLEEWTAFESQNGRFPPPLYRPPPVGRDIPNTVFLGRTPITRSLSGI